MEKKFSLTVFLFKEHVKNFDWCIKKEKTCNEMDNMAFDFLFVNGYL